MRALGETFSAYEETVDETFPFVTLPNFEIKGSHARSRSGLETIQYMPIVEGSLKEEWEKYSVENFQAWMEQSKVSWHLMAPTVFSRKGETHSISFNRKSKLQMGLY